VVVVGTTHAFDRDEPAYRFSHAPLPTLQATRMMQLTHDPSISSYYVNEKLYQQLVDSFTDWQRDELAIERADERNRFRALIEKEARLLDQLRFDEWLAMYAPECIYWVPGTPDAGDPRREIAISFDDRRRMEDRIYRLRTGYAWSQAPKSRTVRMVSNVEVFAAKAGDARMVRSNYLISEFRVDGTRLLSGWCGHRFVERAGRWLIEVRQVNLIDCDQNLRNPSIVL
jgi:3-phenylpropionate/cinnamic acid dioxygenase small subunit